jgi:hypothetical protein
MRLMKLLLTALLGILVATDAIVAVRLVHSGWPKALVVAAFEPCCGGSGGSCAPDANRWVGC